MMQRVPYLFAFQVLVSRIDGSRISYRLQRQSVVEPLPAPPPLAGVWKLGRTGRYYDVVQVDNLGQEFEVFPLSDCVDAGQLSWRPTKMFCGRILYLTLRDQGDGTAKVWRSKVGGLQSIGGPGKTRISSVLSMNEQRIRQKLVWDDGKVWTPVDRPPVLLDFWDDGECMALEGPGITNDPLEYEVYFGASASLSFKNIPGVTADNFNCIENDWLAAHKRRFECILKKSVAHYNASEDGSSTMLSNALEHLTQLLPKDSGIKGCVPNVCFGLSFPAWPVPSPVPTVSIFLTWPVNYNQCNGVSLDSTIAEVKDRVQGGADLVAEVQKSEVQQITGAAHGLSFTLFPVPESAYFAMGVASLTNMYHRLISKGHNATFQEVGHKCPDTRRLDALVKKSIEACPSIKRRFEIRAGDETLFAGAQSEIHKRRLIASSFPELGKSHHKKPHKHGIGWGVGTYGQLGWTGVAGGIFGGGHFKMRDLYNNFNGCDEWKSVISLWHSNPLFDLDPDEVLEILPDCILDSDKPREEVRYDSQLAEAIKTEEAWLQSGLFVDDQAH